MDLDLSDPQVVAYSLSCLLMSIIVAFLSSTTNMDIRYNHGSLIHCLRASHSQDAPDLLAIGGEHSIAILQVVSHFECIISQQFTLMHQISSIPPQRKSRPSTLGAG